VQAAVAAEPAVLAVLAVLARELVQVLAAARAERRAAAPVRARAGERELAAAQLRNRAQVALAAVQRPEPANGVAQRALANAAQASDPPHPSRAKAARAPRLDAPVREQARSRRPQVRRSRTGPAPASAREPENVLVQVRASAAANVPERLAALAVVRRM
jgi:hypothetical protein